MGLIFAGAGWVAAAVLYLQWRCAQHEAEGWRQLFEAHYVDPNFKGHS